ncbi:MAG TPA: primase-helicase family protein, partial [Stellaceae bacterium]|nr:primase-helicase family protein [Stellaceae bacterium]
MPTRTFWPGGSVNSRIPPIKLTDKSGQPVLDKDGKQVVLSAGAWLDRNRPVEQMTWAPGLPMVIHDKLILEGGWIDRRGVTCFNLYQPPAVRSGNAAKAARWVGHVRYVFPEEAEHIIDWLAHRVQRPEDKINHALVLGGQQGIGKDTILEPVKYAVGPWNFHEASPQQILGRFNGFLKSVILRVSEARDLGEFDRFAFYDHMKAYTAAPPDVLRV